MFPRWTTIVYVFRSGLYIYIIDNIITAFLFSVLQRYLSVIILMIASKHSSDVLIESSEIFLVSLFYHLDAGPGLGTFTTPRCPAIISN